MIKTILLILLGLFFVLNGLNHLVNAKVLEEYAEKKGLFSPKIMVLLSGVALIGGGISMVIEPVRIYGILALCAFLIIASFTIHRFWSEKDRTNRLVEGMHFAKNLAILTELVYIGWA
ncbi:MAG: DoxX family membrane protein [Saprospiraceae bacterium]|nr:DoxX family membrane protein [Saprospiraceae bacterium]